MNDLVKKLADNLAAQLKGAAVFTERVTNNAAAPYYLVRLLQREMKRELSGQYLVQDTLEVLYKPKNAFESALAEQMSQVTEALRAGGTESPISLRGKVEEGAVSISFAVSYRAKLEQEPETLIMGSKIKIITGDIG